MGFTGGFDSKEWFSDSCMTLGLVIVVALIVKSGLLTPHDSCNPMDYSPPGSSLHGILQARILEWIAISFSRVMVKSLPAMQETWV